MELGILSGLEMELGILSGWEMELGILFSLKMELGILSGLEMELGILSNWESRIVHKRHEITDPSAWPFFYIYPKIMKSLWPYSFAIHFIASCCDRGF
jgi:hypothetical protein